MVLPATFTGGRKHLIWIRKTSGRTKKIIIICKITQYTDKPNMIKSIWFPARLAGLSVYEKVNEFILIRKFIEDEMPALRPYC